MRRRLRILIIAVPLLVVGGDFLLWRFAVARLQAGLDAWTAGQRSAGWMVGLTGSQTGGWPFAATLTLRDVTIQGGDPAVPGGVAWTSDHLVLRIAMLRPTRLEIAAAGAGHLRVADSPDVAYTAAHLSVALPLQAGGPPRALDVRANDLRAGLPAGPVGIDSLAAHAALTPTAGQGEAAVTLAIDATGVSLPPAMKWALGPRIAAMSISAALDGPLPRDGGLTARATSWRDDGGSLEIRRLETTWGPLGLTATATLALDLQLQPMGAGAAKVKGYAETADAMASHGLMSRSAATAAKALLSLLAGVPDDGQPSEVEVPLSLQYRTLSMRQVPLVRLPELDWPPQ